MVNKTEPTKRDTKAMQVRTLQTQIVQKTNDRNMAVALGYRDLAKELEDELKDLRRRLFVLER